MTTITKFIKGNKYVFKNEGFSNSKNWGHKSQLFINDKYVIDNKTIYDNRTWESYQFQTVMKQTANKYLDKLLKEFISKFKHNNNVLKLSKESKTNLEEKFRQENQDLYQLLNEL